MATTQKKKQYVPKERPQELNNMFYGLGPKLDENQKTYKDALWDEEKRIVFCNAPTGSGKTTIAVGVANLQVEVGGYNRVFYIVSPCEESRQGFLPGSIGQKSAVYFEGLYQALETININPSLVISTEDVGQEGSGTFVPLTHTFLRGQNFGRDVIIIDEAQNFTEDELRKTITRCKDKSKVIVIGHTGQIDLPNKSRSGFEKCLQHFARKEDSRVAICTLTENYRGWVSKTADEPWE